MNTAKTKSLELLHSWKFWVVGISLAFLLHAPFLNRPPESEHTWRQCNTLAMARNFYQEGMNPLEPKVDNRFWTNGVTGSQFPSYEVGLAAIYFLTGEQFWVHRLYSFLFYLWGAIGIYFLFRILFKDELGALISFWGYLWSPLLFYHGINALPDILALPASIWGLYFFLRWWERQGSPSLFIAALGFTVLAGLTKLQFLAIGFFIGGFLLSNIKKLNLQNTLIVGIYGLLSVAIPLAWYAYAKELIATSGLADFGLELRPMDDFYKGMTILAKNFFSDLPDLLLNYSGFIFLLAGIYYYHKKIKKQTPFRWGILLWAVGLFAYHLVELSQMRAHQYYMFPYFPLMLIFAGLGASQIFKTKAWKLVILLLLAQPVFASLRIIPSRWMSERKNVPTELYQEASRNRLIAMVPDTASCIVGLDGSNCIYFYFLKKKGFGTINSSHLLKIMPWNENRLDYYIRKGAKYIYLDDEKLYQSAAVQRRVVEEIGREGRFIVARLE